MVVGRHTEFKQCNSLVFYVDYSSLQMNKLDFVWTRFNLLNTNISVIEITTTIPNLPRINYEGFSYQDALGSELVVNGTF